MAKLTPEEKQDKLLKALRKAKKGLTAKEAVEVTGLSPDDVRAAGKALLAAKKVKQVDGKLEAVVSKDKAPEAKSKTTSKGKKAPKESDDDDDEDDEDWDDEDGDEDDDPDDDDDEDDDDDDEDEDEAPKKKVKSKAKAKKSSDDDEDDDDEDDEDDDPDDEDDEDDEDEDEEDDEDEAPVKKGKSKAKPAPKAAPAKKGKKAQEFQMQYKPIDQLTDKELAARLEDGLEAAEALLSDGHKHPAELIMRAIAKVKRQIAKRDNDEDDD